MEKMIELIMKVFLCLSMGFTLFALIMTTVDNRIWSMYWWGGLDILAMAIPLGLIFYFLEKRHSNEIEG